MPRPKRANPKAGRTTPYVKVKKLSDYGVLPERATSGSAGFDLTSPAAGSIPPGATRLVPLDLSLEIPEGYVGLIKSRSSIAKRAVHVGAGVVDSDYRGPVLVCFTNGGEQSFEFGRGDRIAQILIVAVLQTPMQLIEQEEVTATERNEGGFGSTGK